MPDKSEAFKGVNRIVNDKVVKPRSVLINAEYQNLERVFLVGKWKKKEGLYIASSHNIHETIALVEEALADLKGRL